MSACQCEDRPCCGCDSYAAQDMAANEWRGYDESMTGWPDDCHHDADDEGDGEWPEG